MSSRPIRQSIGRVRHTHYSLLFDACAHLREVQDRFVKTTMDIYTHATKKVKEEAIMKFAGFIGI